MKTIYKSIFGGLLALLLFASCAEDDLRTVYPHSTPVIESATINPSSFFYGDSVTITASVSDAKTPLSTLEMKMIINDKVVATQSIRTKGTAAEVSSKFLVPYVSELPEGAEVEVQMTLINVEGDETSGTISGVTGHRTYYDQLYLVLEDGNVITLNSTYAGSDQYESSDVRLTNSISYKIASKLTEDNEIDYSGDVWGFENSSVQLIGESGGYITTTDATLRKITKIVFNTYSFDAAITGEVVDPLGLYLSDFSVATVSGEAFYKVTRSFTEGQGLKLYEDLADAQIVYNPDYFDRIDVDSVNYTGPTGSYDLYYSSTRKILLVDPADKTFPDILFACGMGLGYPSKIKPEATSSWGFDNVLQCIYFKEIADDTYQGTVYFDASLANFKFFESTGWSNEKVSDDYTLPSILQSSADYGNTDGNWYPATDAVSGNYRITINLSTNIVTAEAITLP